MLEEEEEAEEDEEEARNFCVSLGVHLFAYFFISENYLIAGAETEREGDFYLKMFKFDGINRQLDIYIFTVIWNRQETRWLSNWFSIVCLYVCVFFFCIFGEINSSFVCRRRPVGHLAKRVPFW